jgi:hypothetical protein
VPTVLAGTAHALLSFDTEGGKRRTQLEGHDVGALAPESWQKLWAVVDGQEIWRSDEIGGDWKRIKSLADLSEAGLHAKCLADTRANDDGGILIGTSRAHLVRLERDVLEPLESFDRAPGRDRWYTPWGGPPDVRSISENRDAVFVNVHVGGVLRSRDGGATWQATIDINADVHRVATGSGRVYAAGARGLSISHDGGGDWRLSARGLHAGYCRSVAVCGEAVLLSASDGPGGGRAALYRTDLDAKTFERCRDGLPEWFEGNIDSLCLDALPDGSLSAFGSDSGDVFISKDEGSSWSPLAEGLTGLRCVLVLP